MKVISALYDNPIKPYREMSLNMVESLHRLGYKPEDWVVYGLKTNPNRDENHETGRYMPVFEEKLHLVYKALTFQKEDLAWIDVDCLVQARFDDILDGCDFCTTLRRPLNNWTNSSIFDGFTNTGIFFVRHNKAGFRMLDLWIKHLQESSYGDQEAMNRLLIKHNAMKLGINNVDGIRVKLVTCEEYNNFYFDGSEKAAKILHFKGQFDRKLYQLHVERLLGDKHAVQRT